MPRMIRIWPRAVLKCPGTVLSWLHTMRPMTRAAQKRRQLCLSAAPWLARNTTVSATTDRHATSRTARAITRNRKDTNDSRRTASLTGDAVAILSLTGPFANVAELADAPDLGSGGRQAMGVRPSPFAPLPAL